MIKIGSMMMWVKWSGKAFTRGSRGRGESLNLNDKLPLLPHDLQHLHVVRIALNFVWICQGFGRNKWCHIGIFHLFGLDMFLTLRILHATFGDTVVQNLLEDPHQQEEYKESWVVPCSKHPLQDEPNTFHKSTLSICCQTAECNLVKGKDLGVSEHPKWETEVNDDCVGKQTWHL